jgi:hypothetical protein
MSARLRAASLIAVAAISALPKIDLPETAFDETDAPTIQAVLMTEAASSKCITSGAASAPMPFARTRKVRQGNTYRPSCFPLLGDDALKNGSRTRNLKELWAK